MNEKTLLAGLRTCAEVKDEFDENFEADMPKLLRMDHRRSLIVIWF